MEIPALLRGDRRQARLFGREGPVCKQAPACRTTAALDKCRSLAQIAPDSNARREHLKLAQIYKSIGWAAQRLQGLHYTQERRACNSWLTLSPTLASRRGSWAETEVTARAVGVAGHLIRGKNVATNIGLATITLRKITTTGGVRLLDRRLILAAQWSSFGANNDVPAGYLPATGYELVKLYMTWHATKDIMFTASIDNLLNQYYRPYAVPGNSTDGTNQSDVLWSSPGPGRVYKAGLKIHFGGA